MGATKEDLLEMERVSKMTDDERDALQDLLDEREKAKESKRNEEEKNAIKRSKTLMHKGRLAKKGFAFYKVEAFTKGQKFTRLVELSALPSKKHENVVFEELEVFLLKDMGIDTPTQF